MMASDLWDLVPREDFMRKVGFEITVKGCCDAFGSPGSLGNTFRECGSEIWNRKGLKSDEFPHAQLGPIPLRNAGSLWIHSLELARIFSK